MNQVKEHLDKIIAIALVVICFGWIAKTHLEVKELAVTNGQIEGALEKVQTALKNKAKPAVVPNYSAVFEQHMASSEARLNGDLVSWKFYPMPLSSPPPPEKWELEAVFADVTGAEKGAKILKDDGVQRIRILGRRLRLEGFVSKLDPAIDALSRKCTAAGAKSVDVVDKGAVAGVDYAALGAPTLAVSGIMVGKAVLRGSLGTAGDKHCEKSVVQVWRKKGTASAWPAQPMVTMVISGGKVSALPAGVATIKGDGFEIVESKLPARERFEYRVRKAACFVKEVHKGEEVVEVLPPKAGSGAARATDLDVALGKKAAFATPFGRVVRVVTPGEVQIQFAGSKGFRLRRKVAGMGTPVSTYKVFKLGDRIKWYKDVRVKVGTRSVLKRFWIDAEANLVAVTKEKRRLPVKRYVFEKDPETGATVQKIKMVPGPEVDVQVAVIEDVRGGKKHKLDKAMRRDSGWWPKNVVMETRTEPGPSGTNGGRDTGDRRGPRRGPVKPKSTGPAAVTPKPVVTKPVVTKPVVTKPVVRTPVSRRPVEDGVDREDQPEDMGPPMDPGGAPMVSDPSNTAEKAAYEAWQKKKKRYEDYVKTKKESERN